MKRLLVALLAVACIGISVPVAQNINKSVQLSQDPSGQIGYDNQNGVYFPGKLYTSNNQTAPSVNACGTTPTITGTNLAGTIIEGTGTVTSCQMNFATAFPATPYCVASTNSAATPVGVAATPNGVTFSQVGSAASTRITYLCFGQQP